MNYIVPNYSIKILRLQAFVSACFFIAILQAFFSVPQLQAVSLEVLEKNFRLETARIEALSQKKSQETSRKEWLASISRLRRIYQMSPPKLAASCLWQMAVSSRDLYLRFENTSDLDRALVNFRDLANLFPRDIRADNALFTAAKLHQTKKNNQELATRYFKRIVSLYPAGDMAQKAKKELSSQPRVAPSTQRTEYHHPLQAELETVTTAKVSQVKFWSTPYYARIVIRSKGGTSYFSRLVDGEGKIRSRIILDLENSLLSPSIKTKAPSAEGPLGEIRLTQHTSSSVRAIIDLREHIRHKIFSLSDPFRIIIDIQGKTPPPAPKITPRPARPAPPPVTARVKVKEEKSKIPILKPGFRVKRRPGSKKVPSTISLAKQLGLHVGRVVIDPGHGAHDPGASGNGLVEKDLVLAIAKKTAHILRNTYGIEVFMTRTTDVFVPLEERTVMANTNRADLFVSIHINAAAKKSIRGLETYFLNLATDDNAMRLAAYENATSTHKMSELQDILTDLLNNSKKKESALLAKDVQNSMVSVLKKNGYSRAKDLGVKQAPFYVLLGAEMPAVLVECFFLSNPHDASFLKRQKNMKLLSLSLAKGISRYIKTVNQAGRLPSRTSPTASMRKKQSGSRL